MTTSQDAVPVAIQLSQKMICPLAVIAALISENEQVHHL